VWPIRKARKSTNPVKRSPTDRGKRLTETFQEQVDHKMKHISYLGYVITGTANPNPTSESSKAPRGLFVSFPVKKQSDGNHWDIAFPVKAETRPMIEQAILAEYEKIVARAIQYEARTRSQTQNNV
jgi:SpoVG